MTRPRLLDLFCGAGGAAMGYQRAGFDVVGVDIAEQRRYPFEFVRADALSFLDAGGWIGFDAIHASPPCQRWSTMTRKHGIERVETHPDLLDPTRRRLEPIGLPYVIENVPGSPIRGDLLLCGTSFGLNAGGRPLRRHRYFETNLPLILFPPCQHDGRAETIGVYGHAGGSSVRDVWSNGSTDEWRAAMGIDWMVGSELAEAIPPAYTEWIGERLLAAVTAHAATP